MRYSICEFNLIRQSRQPSFTYMICSTDEIAHNFIEASSSSSSAPRVRLTSSLAAFFMAKPMESARVVKIV